MQRSGGGAAVGVKSAEESVRKVVGEACKGGGRHGKDLEVRDRTSEVLEWRKDPQTVGKGILAWEREHTDRANRGVVFICSGEAMRCGVGDELIKGFPDSYVSQAWRGGLTVWHKTDYLTVTGRHSVDDVREWLAKCSYKRCGTCETCRDATLLSGRINCSRCKAHGCLKCWGLTNRYTKLLEHKWDAEKMKWKFELLQTTCPVCKGAGGIPIEALKEIESHLKPEKGLMFMKTEAAVIDAYAQSQLDGDCARANPDVFECANCGLSGARQRCPCPLHPHYCNKSCQKADWSKHKPSCLTAQLENGNLKETASSELRVKVQAEPWLLLVDWENSGYIG